MSIQTLTFSAATAGPAQRSATANPKNRIVSSRRIGAPQGFCSWKRQARTSSGIGAASGRAASGRIGKFADLANRQLEIDASEIRIRAERRIGELMAAQRDTGLLKPGGDGSNQHKQWVAEKPKAPTLSEVGIDKNLADRARDLGPLQFSVS
ncbi:hypothetical protein ACMDCR_25800 [Labrys okinawensis]|uniref:hypothetical protein n=1 Tax=Labrys okinawensis TaxID=346911 RepID=UPI0039BCEC6E